MMLDMIVHLVWVIDIPTDFNPIKQCIYNMLGSAIRIHVKQNNILPLSVMWQCTALMYWNGLKTHETQALFPLMSPCQTIMLRIVTYAAGKVDSPM